MNKQFSRRWVSQEADKLPQWDKDNLIYGDILAVSDYVARDELGLGEVQDQLRILAQNRADYAASFADEEQQRIYEESIT